MLACAAKRLFYTIHIRHELVLDEAASTAVKRDLNPGEKLIFKELLEQQEREQELHEHWRSMGFDVDSHFQPDDNGEDGAVEMGEMGDRKAASPPASERVELVESKSAKPETNAKNTKRLEVDIGLAMGGGGSTRNFLAPVADVAKGNEEKKQALPVAKQQVLLAKHNEIQSSMFETFAPGLVRTI